MAPNNFNEVQNTRGGRATSFTNITTNRGNVGGLPNAPNVGGPLNNINKLSLKLKKLKLNKHNENAERIKLNKLARLDRIRKSKNNIIKFRPTIYDGEKNVPISETNYKVIIQKMWSVINDFNDILSDADKKKLKQSQTPDITLFKMLRNNNRISKFISSNNGKKLMTLSTTGNTTTNIPNDTINKNKKLEKRVSILRELRSMIGQNPENNNTIKQRLNKHTKNVLKNITNTNNPLIIDLKYNEYMAFINLIERDIIHDGFKPTTPDVRKKMIENLINILIDPRYRTNTNTTKLKNKLFEDYIRKYRTKPGSEIETKEMLLRLIGNRSPRISNLSVSGRALNNMGVLSNNPNLPELYVAIDSDTPNPVIKSKLINHNPKFKALATPASVMDAGHGMSGYGFNAYYKDLCNRRKPGITCFGDKFKISHSPVKVIINCEKKYRTVFEIGYNINTGIIIKINGKKIKVIKRSQVNYNNIETVIGKFMGDFGQILTVIYHNIMLKNNVAFSTIDKTAALIFLFLGNNAYRKYKREYNTRAGLSQTEIRNNRSKIQGINFILKPKLLYAEQFGSLRGNQNIHFTIHFYNLGKYLNRNSANTND